jgi:hypothetical protein
MSATIDALTLDMLEWIAREPKPYAEVMEVWRTSCPRLTVWEDAVDRGLLVRENIAGAGLMVVVTAKGRSLLAGVGRLPA